MARVSDDDRAAAKKFAKRYEAEAETERLAALPERIKAPRGLPAAIRQIFTALVAARPPDHFSEADIPLLTSYSQVTAELAHLATKISGADDYDAVEDMTANGQPMMSVAARRQMSLLRLQTGLATALRLSPHSRTRTSDLITRAEKLQEKQRQREAAGVLAPKPDDRPETEEERRAKLLFGGKGPTNDLH